MKISSFLAILTSFLFLNGLAGELPEQPTLNQKSSGGETAAKDIMTYRAQIWIEKDDLARYGGEQVFKTKLKTMFHDTTRFWNESENKFQYYFHFVPGEELQIYDIKGNQDRYEEFRRQAFGHMDTNKFDFVVFFALNAKHNGLSAGGGGKSGQVVVNCYQTLEQQEKHGDIFSAVYPQLGMYSNLGHEYGHVRGATDMYQYIIHAKNNPVSGESLVPPPCNMGTGCWVWSDYCSLLFNYTAHQKQLDKDLNRNVFPSKLRIKVLVDGQAGSGVNVNLYGTRAGGSKNDRDVYPHVYRTYTTDKNGSVEIVNVYELYHPDPNDPSIPPKDEFPYWYWFAFLVEADNGNAKKYIWIPDWATQISKLQGREVHEEIISF